MATKAGGTAVSCAIFDMDGVIHRGESIMPGAAQSLQALEKAGISVFFMTNNSSKSRDDYSRKLAGLGIKAPKDRIYTSALGAAKWASANGARTAYVVGEEGLERELEAFGVKCIRSGQPDAVVVGLDREITYAKIDAGMHAILNGAMFIVTNPDSIYTREKDFGPGAGVMVAALQAACGKKPDYVAGKPTTHMIDDLLADWKIRKSTAVFIGDRLDTDIKCANSAGLKSILVLTGVSRHEDALKAAKGEKPDLILKSIADVTPEILKQL